MEIYSGIDNRIKNNYAMNKSFININGNGRKTKMKIFKTTYYSNILNPRFCPNDKRGKIQDAVKRYLRKVKCARKDKLRNKKIRVDLEI